MKRLFAITVVMLLSSAMFFVVVCAGGDSVTKPFKGKWTGNLYVLGPCPDPSFQPGYSQGINIGKGVSTLTGESDFLFVYCTICSEPTNTPPYFCNTINGSGWGIITAANGDALHVEITYLEIDLTDPVPQWTELETLVGGTGRFEDATGSSDSHGIWTLGTDPFPFGNNPSIPPQLLQPPQGWVGTTEGEITF
jgi:hypothetical protein